MNIEDLPKQLTVTQEHINNGVKCSSACCPIALALAEVLKGNLLWHSVGPDTMHLRTDDGRRFNAPTSQDALNFISQFDHGETKPQPTTIQLEWKEID